MTTFKSSCSDKSTKDESTLYYRVLEDIIELQYREGYKAVLFKCAWAKITHHGVKVDVEANLTLVNLSNLIRSDHMVDKPFILAEHAIQLSVSFMDHTTHSLDSNSAVADTAGNIPSRASSSSRRRGPSRGFKPLPDGKKNVVVNSWGHPIRGVNSYSATIGTLTLNHIPINYKKFTNVPDEFIHIVKIELERNAPDEDVTRADVFINAHTKADKTYRCPEIIEKLQENMILYPDSNKIGYDDVLAKRRQSNLNRECKLSRCPKGIVAYGIVADVSLDVYFHNKHLKDGYYKIEIFNVFNEDALLFRQDSFTKKMEDVGTGGFVAWPKFMRDDLLSEVLEALIVIRGLVVQKTKLISHCNRNLKDLLESLLLESSENKRQFIRACISGLQIHDSFILYFFTLMMMAQFLFCFHHHALEGVSGENEIGSRAKNLLDRLSDMERKGDGYLEEKNCKLCHATRDKMRRQALRKREELLQGLGMRQELSSDGGERIIVVQPSIEDLEDVEEEEDGVACMVCREGYSLWANDMLGIYSYSKRVNLGAGTSGSSRSKHYPIKSDHDLLEMGKYSDVERVGDVHFYDVNKGLAQEHGNVDILDEEIVVPPIYMDIDVNNDHVDDDLFHNEVDGKLFSNEVADYLNLKVLGSSSDDLSGSFSGYTTCNGYTTGSLSGYPTRSSSGYTTRSSSGYTSGSKIEVDVNILGVIMSMVNILCGGAEECCAADYEVQSLNVQQLGIDTESLDVEEGYYSTHTSQDGEDGPTEEVMHMVDEDLRDFAVNTKNIFVDEENTENANFFKNEYDELKVGIMWGTVYEARQYLRKFAIINKFEYYHKKNEDYKLRYKCCDRKYEWMFYAGVLPDKHTMEPTILTWNAWTIYMERIVGSYDKGYIVMPELTVQVLLANPDNIASCSIDLDTNE
ncbi:hypothetical protein GIB67_019430 [Kingdonia uniflora]|uniref:Transposase MuDR plant domain-containing protein n=1 Tax=Kingdonia uniflora TaxID=39325 RepID=A0A7J7L6Q0_9MAGN|nr:hypothetical protein GIB67_019430 [Kingdonia uniflora]